MSKEIVKRKASPSEFREGIKDGIPISLGYFAVAFTLGIAQMRNLRLMVRDR